MNDSRWQRAVSQILTAADRPLSAEEIAGRAISQQLILAPSLCPESSVCAAIRTHVRNGNRLGIVSSKDGRMRLFSIARDAGGVL